MTDRKPILCLDFDGVIHSYTSGWKGVDIIPDPPVPGAIDFIVRATGQFTVAVHSSRSKSLRGRRAMKQYLFGHLIDWEWSRCEDEWQKLINVPPDWSPFTHGDVDDVHRECANAILKEIRWPLFKPPALVTIDDRAICFTGEWPTMEALCNFRPWNKQ